MKPVGVFLMTHLTITQFETRRRLIDSELERENVKAAGRRVERRRSRRWFRAVRGAAAA
ncbi:MAG TPA: hypothetical protein VD695_05425 [Gaiellaceae bacterium]|nr:hypothetical protein [Gaiellaceae bacterium]